MEKLYPYGSQWRKWDLQVQTILDDEYIELKEYAEVLEKSNPKEWDLFIEKVGSKCDALKFDSKEYFSTDSTDKPKVRAQNHAKTFIAFLEAFHKEEVCVAITDHNYDHLYLLDALLNASKNSKVNIIGGVEINVQGVHILALFEHPLYEKDTFSEGIATFLSKIEVDRKKTNGTLTVSNRSYTEVLNKINENNGITIYPHCNSDNGLFQERGKTDRTHLRDQFNHQDFNILQGKNKSGGDKLLGYIKSRDHDLTSKCCYTTATDARCLKDILAPDEEGNFTWIKADPTFNGLKQVTYEPARIKIQELLPENKSSYQTIRRVRYLDSSNDKLFSNDWIPLNKDLNTIIGGKSSGKSMLLYHIAKTINPSEVLSSVKKAKSSTYDDMDRVDFEVEWSNGETSKISDSNDEATQSKAITYISQLYINQLADRDGKDDLNNLIRKILMQNDEFKAFVERTKKNISALRTQISEKVDRRFDLVEQHIKLTEEAQEIGSLNSVSNEIVIIKTKSEQLRKKSNFTLDDEKAYKKLTRKRWFIQKAKTKLEAFEANFIDILSNVEDSKKQWIDDIISDISLKSGFSDSSGVLKQLTKNLDSELIKAFDFFISNVAIKKTSIPKRLREIDKKMGTLIELLVPLEGKIHDKTELDNLNDKLKVEEKKLKQINEKMKSRDIVTNNGKVCRIEIADYYKQLVCLYQEMCQKVTCYQVDDHIQIEAKLSVNSEKFEVFSECFNRTGNMQFLLNGLVDKQGKYHFNLNSICEDIEAISKRITHKDAPQLRKHATQQEAFKHLYADHFKIDYVVSYKEDDIVKMSPGKRGLVLLSLMLEMTNSTHPILIDQPEDNLDNRTVYSELKDFVRKCKDKRQIIMVTHNANLVVSADAECVIVADQRGQQDDSCNASEYKFNYFGGSLELSYDNPNGEIYNHLHDMGIRQHVCHILEGGITAFKEREQKYNLR
jgi:ABC-type cobalamin/Fe3+-siderophores transport system ATPase subunit